jgi:hypothetical protein
MPRYFFTLDEAQRDEVGASRPGVFAKWLTLGGWHEQYQPADQPRRDIEPNATSRTATGL